MPGPRAVQNLHVPHSRDWQGGQMPRSSPGGGGVLGAAGIDWCITTGFQRKIVSLRYRTAERRGRQNACVRQPWQPYYLCVWWWSSLKFLFSGLLHEDLFKGEWSSAEKFFKQNYCHACHTRFAVFFPLRNVRWNSIPMTCHYPYLNSASDWSWEMCLNHSEALPRSG